MKLPTSHSPQPEPGEGHAQGAGELDVAHAHSCWVHECEEQVEDEEAEPAQHGATEVTPLAVDDGRDEQEAGHDRVGRQGQGVGQALGVQVDERQGHAHGRQVEVGGQLPREAEA